MKFTISHPSKAIFEGTENELDTLRKELTFVNTAIAHDIKRHYNNYWMRSKDEERWQTTLEDMKKQARRTLVFEENSEIFVHPGSIPYLSDLNVQSVNTITYTAPKKVPWKHPLSFELHPYQEESWKKLLQVRHGNVELCTGCHAKGTKILMYDGSIKNVEEVVVGDKLMGPDSRPRKVIELHNGNDEMYEINPIKGESFTVNAGHILSLQFTNTKREYRENNKIRYPQFKGLNRIENISVTDYLALSKSKKHKLKLYRREVNFNNNNILSIPPYILGAWLGDGASGRCSLTTMDNEIRKEWCDYLLSLGLQITIDHKKDNKASSYNGTVGDYKPLGRNSKGTKSVRQNAFHILLDKYNLINNKHIPFDYLTSSEANRLELLAGLIDTDGHYTNGYVEIVQKNKKLADDILYLARSLGFGAVKREKKSASQNGTVGTYARITITGDINRISVRLKRKQAARREQIKNVLRTGFSIKHAGRGEYFGFTIDEDHLYLMGDFTVTHNSGKSAILLKLCRETGFRTVIVAPSKSIFNELLAKFEYHFGKNMVGTFGAGKKKLGKRFTIAIGDSLVNVKPGTEEWEFFAGLDMLCVDESHTWGADTLETICFGVLNDIPYRFFFSGTQTRGDGTEKLLQSIIGQTVHTLTTRQAVEGGYICPHDYRIVEIESSNPNYATSDVLDMKRQHVLKNRNICHFVAKLANAEALAYKRQTLVLVEELDQIAMLMPLMKVPTAVAHSEKKAIRLADLGISKVDPSESVEAFNRGEALVLIGTSCIATGTNIYPCHNTVNWAGGASEIRTKQGAVGRSVRLHNQNPWASRCVIKNKALIWDFKVYDCDIMVRHLDQRITYYNESGSEIKYIKLNRN